MFVFLTYLILRLIIIVTAINTKIFFYRVKYSNSKLILGESLSEKTLKPHKITKNFDD